MAFPVGIPVPRSAWSCPLLALARPGANAFPYDLRVTAAGVLPELPVVNPVLYFEVGDLTLSTAKALERKALEHRIVSVGRLLTVELCRGRDLI